MRSIIQPKNKKGQFLSILVLVITVFIIAIILLFLNHLNKKVYDQFDEYFDDSNTFNGTEAHQVVNDLQGVEGGQIWDYAFLAIFIGMIIQMIMLSFASRTNIAFFWIFVILGFIVLTVGVMLSNTWQELASNPTFAETILRFPIMNGILGSYYPLMITGIMFLGMLILFGKFPGQQEQ